MLRTASEEKGIGMDRKISPPLAVGQRPTRMSVRFTVAELAAMKRAAARAGRAQHSRWAREVLLAACGEDAPADPHAEAMGRPDPLVRSTDRIGLNLNQAMRLGNIAALQGDRVEAAAILAAVDRVEAAINELVERS